MQNPDAVDARDPARIEAETRTASGCNLYGAPPPTWTRALIRSGKVVPRRTHASTEDAAQSGK